MSSRGTLAPFVASSLLFAFTLLAPACAEHTDATDAPDASTRAAQVRSESGPTLQAAMRLARADETLAHRLALADDGWQQTYDGVTSPGWRGA